MTIYKYFHSYGLKFLSNLSFKLTSPAEVDDPFEMCAQPGSSIATIEMIADLLKRPDRIARFCELTQSLNVKEFTSRVQGDPQELVEWLNRQNPNVINAYCRQSAKGVAKEYSMLWFSRSRDTTLMWSHYGNGHRGLAVGFDSRGLELSLQAKMLEVECAEERAVFDMRQFILAEPDYVNKLLTRKSSSWAYQEEVRYIIRRNENSFVNCPPNLVREVLLGCNFPTEQTNCVRKLMQKNGLRGPLLQGAPDDKLFRIHFTEVEPAYSP